MMKNVPQLQPCCPRKEDMHEIMAGMTQIRWITLYQ